MSELVYRGINKHIFKPNTLNNIRFEINGYHNYHIFTIIDDGEDWVDVTWEGNLGKERTRYHRTTVIDYLSNGDWVVVS